MIIVEGPDGAGKTTLIERLSEDLGIPVAPKVVDHNTNATVNLKLWVEGNVSVRNRPTQEVIYDRHRLISEFIYGPILRERQTPGFNDPDWVRTMLSRLYAFVRPTIIFCLPPLGVVLGNVKGDELNEVVADKMGGIYTAYINIAMLSSLHYAKTMVYDYTKHDYEVARAFVTTMREEI